ncbi:MULTISPECIES: sigma 54-interacting transcriptional regulator [unclassified Psychrobacter]|uniref:sigma 54-interacting transcriptional regulator n=1 Tax=unclassified Psychrobacter TaxID=196806 RepID=UPI000C321456|nr:MULTISPECIES: sigma 54-interacting transcriptional regulator [unclassified Psychrobacter]MBA6244500.1 sigma 54-interacting transcriptional regulator [Psychrobacter sp. Urea-trap-18]MBA6285563.1 sigma 54-interacting transcriptional regulator [Psychrobacter sp. Urea-trap-16]MBA6317748.1 sigma 54-interacting transcriptional regulator [Psychrobacter sp. Urea-trap-20]MBA6334517.1 sigma 54-interacting transcriptional regulator [Psychrobacter sp. Urea-trap-19]PKG60667.1 transcriptional regulator [|tara:strand:- start:4422 stop:6317 length:1896 start_codon:yes stop_codon:yes gene_type:complete
MPHNKPINILFTYLHTPNINGIRSLVEQAMSEINSQDIGFVECHISDVEAVAQQLTVNGCQIILCTGATASYLQKILSIEIQVIRTGMFDVIQAISSLKQYKRIALLGKSTTTVSLEDYSEIFLLDIKQFTYDSYFDAKRTIQLIKKEKFDAVIGSPISVELAVNEGLVGQLTMTVVSLKDLLTNALSSLEKIRREQSTIIRLTEIFNHLNEGVCFITKNKKISFINTSMAQLLKKSPIDVLNKSAVDIFGNLDLDMEHHNPRQLLDIKNDQLAVHILEMNNDYINGYILSAQELNALEYSSSEFRKVSSRNFNTRYQFNQLSTQNATFETTLSLAKAYAKTDSTVLITGESGTGKEVLAQSIHNYSRRSKAPFVAINCASFPESLLESELFGYEEGAFTGAKKNGRIGLIESAHNGTLFLDEIGDMPLHLQTRFLRVLQERQINRLGSTTSHHLNIRVIAATHADLECLVADGNFRADLYYRLNILRLSIPSLKNRPEDILTLADTFLKKHKKSVKDLSDTLPMLLKKYDWPGNIRELENIIERIQVLFSLNESKTQPDFLSLHLPELFSSAKKVDSSSLLKKAKINQELLLVEQVLEEADGNLDLAAKKLGISRTTLWRKMKLIENPVS